MMLKVRLLGAPEISYNERPLSFRTRKVFALFVYLLLEHGMHSRDALTTLLWPEAEPQKAAVTLRSTLSRLRRALGPARKLLLTEAGKIGFDGAYPIDLDLHWLAAACAQLAESAPPSSNQMTPSTADLAPILDIDRGEFLAGFSLPDAPDFDTWTVIERQACQRRVELIYDKLTQAHLDVGNCRAAVETAVRWLARAPFNENAYRQLMTAQALSGDRAAALDTFAHCQSVLLTELDITPAMETAVLAQRIRELRLESGRENRESQNIPAASRRLDRRLRLPFAGRKNEHNHLVAAFRQTVAGDARAVVVIGASGVGKTRLVQTFLEWAALDTPRVDLWRGRAFETGGHLPFEPVIETLRLRLEQENAPEDLLDDVWLAELSQLMPELRGRYPDLPPPMTGEADFVRSRLFAAVAALGSALAARQPVIFILDDMQWADADTRNMIQYVARRWAESGAPILLLLVVRQENYAADTALREWLTHLDRAAPLTRLLVDTLSGTEVQQLIMTLANPAADENSSKAFAEWLWAETGGLPFFIEALLQMFVDQRVLAVAEDGDHSYDFAAALSHAKSVGHAPVPPGVKDVILTRLAQLSEVESGLLLAAAVLGRECSFQRLCQVASVAELAGLPALEALLNGRLLAEHGTIRRPYSLAHDHIREVTYRESGEARRRVLHRRALIALEADGAPAAECAFHAVASLLDEPAFRHSLAAGDEALSAYALQESLAHYDRALEAVRMIGLATTAVAPQALQRLYEHRGRVLELNYHYEEAQANYREMLELAEIRRDLTLRQAALTAQCIIHATYTPLFNPPIAHDLASEALVLARKLADRAAEARVLWCMTIVAFFRGDDSQTILGYGEEALAIARELELKELMGYVLTNLAWTYLNAEQIPAALKANSEARDVHQALGNLPMVADSDTIKSYIYRHTGQYDALLEMGPKALQLSQSIDNLIHQNSVHLNMCVVHSLQGRFGQALAHIETAMAISEKSGQALMFEDGYRSEQATIALWGGAWEQAEQWADKLYANREAFLPIFQTYFFVNIARVKIECGKLDEAKAVLEEAFAAVDRESSSFLTIAPLYVADGRLQFALGNLNAVLDRTSEVIRRLLSVGSRAHLAEAFWLQGKTWLALTKVAPAKEAFLAAQAAAEENSERAILWQILADMARLEDLAGDPGEAASWRRQARKIINYIADNAGSDELRASFLHRPDVQELG